MSGAGDTDPALSALLAEQEDYYRARAGEYDDWFYRRGRYDRGAQHTAAYAVALARRYAANGDWPRAMMKAERTTHVAPFDADYRELAAEVAIRFGDWQAAIRHIEALIKIEPDREIHQRRLEAIRERADGN